MKYINELPLLEKEKSRIVDSIENYKRFAKVYIRILKVKDKEITVRIEQKELVNNKLLTLSELLDRVKNVFADLPADWKIHGRALTYKGGKNEPATAEDLKREMEKRNIKASHLVLYLGVDKHAISKLLSKDKPLTGFQAAAFKYLWKWLDLVGDKTQTV